MNGFIDIIARIKLMITIGFLSVIKATISRIKLRIYAIPIVAEIEIPTTNSG